LKSTKDEYRFPLDISKRIVKFNVTELTITKYVEMQQLENILNEINRRIEFHEKLSENVSKVSIGWHLEHTMLVLINVAQAIEASNPSDYRFQFKLIRYVIMTIKKIPRGKARAPKGVCPAEEGRTVKSLQAQLQSARLSVQKLGTLNKNQFFAHPYFGNMKLKAAVKFLGIHSNHHLAIVKDILG
jgi:hypothetical protein